MSDTPRDTQFAGVAKLQWEDLYSALNFVGLKFNPVHKESLDKHFQTLIARRAYDFAIHVLSHTGDEDTGSWEHAIPCIPDMTQWPKEETT